MDATQKHFQYGRIYQLVLDKSKAVPNVPGRAAKIQEYIKTRTKEQIIEEAHNIVTTAKKRKDWANIWTHVENLDADDEYYGRCVQFLLDSNYKRQIVNLITLGKDKVIKKALENREKQLFKQCKNMVFDTSKLCHYMCEGGCTWMYGDNRCSGGNRKYVLGWDGLQNLDETELYFYPETF